MICRKFPRAILDADKEVFDARPILIQTIGRCARNLNGRAILYADHMTDSMNKAINETDRRRAIQQAYNEENGITPQSIIRSVDMALAQIVGADYTDYIERPIDSRVQVATRRRQLHRETRNRYARSRQALRI